MDRPGRQRFMPSRRANPCRQFARGSCRYGDKCKFSHDEQKENLTPAQSAIMPSLDASNDITDNMNRFLELLDRAREASSRPTINEIQHFFRVTEELVNSDVVTMQRAVRFLSEEDGLSYIQEVAERHLPPAIKAKDKWLVWEKQLRPLFRCISHPKVVDSAVLEQEVATIYNYIQGVGCRRMKAIFDFIIGLIVSWDDLPEKTSQASILSLLELSLSVFAKMIDCNTTNIVRVEFPPVLQALAECIPENVQVEEEFLKIQATQYLEYIRRRLGIGESIPFANPTTGIPTPRATFRLRTDLPGNLSSDGPRHSNDYADFTKIGLMPAYDEILSTRQEYLPTTDSSHWHVPGILGRLDREFRLLREDTVGALRDAVANQLERMQMVGYDGQTANRDRSQLRTYTYDNVKVLDAGFNRFVGLEIAVQFSQPAPRSSLQSRRQWWEQSKRLLPGGLVCLIDSNKSVLFFVVAESTTRVGGQKEDNARKNDPDLIYENLSDDAQSSFVRLSLAEAGAEQMRGAMAWYPPSKEATQRCCLVEFPGVLLAGFKHTLEALQNIGGNSRIPFTQLLAPVTPDGQEAEVPVPQYTLKPGFTFNLKALTVDQKDLFFSVNGPPQNRDLTSCKILDPTQRVAMSTALTRGLCLIQGPPGTGKSYTGEKVIRVLLDSKNDADLGPIICVCYTNHALDQLLEHLLDQDIDRVIRIGYGSKVQRLQDVNLRLISRAAAKTRAEKDAIQESRNDLDTATRELNASIAAVKDSTQWHSVKHFLEETHPSYHRQLYGQAEVGWDIAGNDREKKTKDWLSRGSRATTLPRSLEALRSVKLHEMSNKERQDLHASWVAANKDPILTKMSTRFETFLASKKRYDAVHADIDLRCLNNVDVIGLTTTGLARNLSLLRRLRSKILVCEEAGEVLESHILTALLPSLEHVVLIGDHLQLRPQVQNYNLRSDSPRGFQYSLDTSLFERLVRPQHPTDIRVPFTTLETQRRMHPSISELIRLTLYPALKDGETVKEYDSVPGMRKRLFWLDHKYPEDGALSHDPSNTSHSNNFEVELTTAVVGHLLRQGTFSSGQIALLTPYLGQLRRLKNRMESMVEIALNDRDLADLEEHDMLDRERNEASSSMSTVRKAKLTSSLRIATVDNFQGEEAEVVIVSLVRSNKEQRCGFLNTPNRINVLLSRAKRGMYIVGNSQTYGNVKMWADVIETLQDKGNFGSALELECPRHPGTSIRVSRPDHFLQFSPDGGCLLPCLDRLECGHKCNGRCHSSLMHAAVKCLEKCPRPKVGCEHPCSRPCGDACERMCSFVVKNANLVLPCAHQLKSVPCWQMQNPEMVRCKQLVQRIAPDCNHKVMVECWQDITLKAFECSASCGHVLPCDHACRNSCHQCRRDGIITLDAHRKCNQKCERLYKTCGHRCISTCHGDKPCPPCESLCDTRCSHSRCSKQCNQPCVPCAEATCASSCPHSRCTMPCAAPCDWIPCSERCTNLLSCGHQCPSLCGEPCPQPQFCQRCGLEEVKTTQVDYIMMTEYQDINLDEDPCIIPPCGHIITVSSMDGQMDMAKHFKLDAEGRPTTILSSSTPFDMTEVKVCPKCRGSLRNISRYGRIVRRGLLDEATKKFVSWSNSTYIDLAKKLLEEKENLDHPRRFKKLVEVTNPGGKLPSAERFTQLRKVSEWTGHARYPQIMKLNEKIYRFAGKVKQDEQPFQRVADLVQYAKRQNKTNAVFDFDESAIQLRGNLVAMALLLKCEIVIFSDFMKICKQGRKNMVLDFSKHLASCEELVASAHKTSHYRQELEGHIYYAQFAVLTIEFAPVTGGLTPYQGPAQRTPQEMKEVGLEHVAAARGLVETYALLQPYMSEVNAVEQALDEGLIFGTMTNAEMRAIYRVMEGELSGTGHWYTCANGHPFTVGQCGLPMEQARCPDCGFPIGGQNHETAEGVQQADEIEELARGLANVGL